MTVVSDAGPLIALARIGRTDILTSLFREVHIPPAVLREITDDARSNRTGATEFASASWLIRDRLVRSSGEYLQDRLGAGESEAIVLAADMNADVLLMDDERGRRVAVKHGRALRWEGGAGDAEFTPETARWLTQWLLDHNVPLPKDEVADALREPTSSPSSSPKAGEETNH